MLNIEQSTYENAAVVALGSNLRGSFASRRDLLDAVLAQLPEMGLEVIASSRWWRSAAWPDAADPEYLNGVALVEAALEPEPMMAALMGLERAFGRLRGDANRPRTLDLDIVAHGRRVMARESLVLPHPRAHLRRFVMGPLAEIAPGWTHPVLGQTAQALLARATVGLDAAPV
jgi:2-amino-4-hydroxy-6-hydroxymethyldihydropteridine diphosphokinase